MPQDSSRTRAIAGNTAVQVAGKFVGTLLGILTVGVMTRHLGQSGYGQFTTVMSFLQFFGILVDFGLTLTMVKMVSLPDTDESEVASNIFTLRLLSGAVFFGVAPAVALFLPYPTVVKAGIALGALSFLGITLSSVLVGIFQKHLAMHRAAIAEVAGRTVLLLGAFLAARAGAGLLSFIGVLVAANLIQFLLVFLFTRSFTRVGLAFDTGLWKRIIRESWPIGLAIAFNLVYLKGDIIILSLSRPEAEVGLYGAAYKILDVVTVIPMVFMGLVLPLITASWSSGNRREYGRRLGRAFSFLSLLALPLVFGTLAVSRDLMALIAGESFASSGTYLSILMLGAAMVFWGALFGHAIVAQGLQRKVIPAYAADAIISILLYILLIPRFGAVAAAWVTVFSEAFIACFAAAMVIRTSRQRPSLDIFSRSLLASLGMFAVVLWAGPWHVLIRIMLGIASYGGLLFLFRGLTRDMLQDILRRPRTP
ncbi:hypothetical protein AMJ57_04825 [Parcubacteria bacterium SG8_24]|nr:MAG: hypothetical protein AMJ57_04825 [Parcubacteria bacterium SG8_24]